MVMEIARLLALLAIIAVITATVRKWFFPIGIGIVGVLLIILPTGLSLYKDVHPITQLVFIVVGIFVIFADVSRVLRSSRAAK